jgi:hypothetical protein
VRGGGGRYVTRMPSLFGKDPGEQKPLSPYAHERIEKGVEHLKKRGPVRTPQEVRRTLGIWVTVLVVLGLLTLFFMDPVVYSFERGRAMDAYLYLHGFGSEDKVRALAATGIFTNNEVEFLNRRQGTFQDFFATPTAATQAADNVIGYMNGLVALHTGRYDRLDWLGKIRYQIFIRWGLETPTHWDFLDPSVSR